MTDPIMRKTPDPVMVILGIFIGVFGGGAMWHFISDKHYSIALWIGFSVYHAYTKTTVPQVLKEQLAPLDPSLDNKTLESLKEKKYIAPEDLANMPEITQFEMLGEIAPATQAASPSAEHEF